MASKLSRVTEAEVGLAVLQILSAQVDGSATVAYLRQHVAHTIVLTQDDREISLTRENEELWEQQVRNLKCHAGVAGNLFTEGFVESARRGVWRITESGRLHLRRHSGL